MRAVPVRCIAMLLCVQELALSRAPAAGGGLERAPPPAAAGVLQLRGGARDVTRRNARDPLASSSSRVTFGKSRRVRPDRESEHDESWKDHSRSLGAPDGKHTPGKPPKATTRRGKRKPEPASAEYAEDSDHEESSLRFARLGAPDGKHTPAAPRSGSASRWSDLLDSSTEAPARSGSPGQSDVAASRAPSKASDTHPSSRRVLFSVDEEPDPGKASAKAPATPLPGVRPAAFEKRAGRGTGGSSSSSGGEEDEHADGTEAGEVEGESELDIDEETVSNRADDTDEETAEYSSSESDGQRQSESGEEEEEMEADSDYQEIMSVRRQKKGPAARGGTGTGDAKMCGVGMLLECDAQGTYRVTRLAAGGSASEHGGIIVGDAIDRVDATPLHGKSLEEVANCVCGPAGTYVRLHLLRGKKRMPVAVRLRRRPLHEGPPDDGSRAPSLDSRIANLVADMSYNEVADMVAELEQDEERQKVWEVWKSIHSPLDDADGGSSQGEGGEGKQLERASGAGDDPGPPDLAQTMRAHNRQVDSLLKDEELRRERRAEKARKKTELQEKAAAANSYRGSRAVYRSPAARRMGFRTRTKAVDAPSQDLDVMQELKKLNTVDKLKGDTFGARGSKRSGSKDASQVQGLKASTLRANSKLKLDFGGL